MRWYSKTFDRKAEASRWLNDQLNGHHRGEWVDRSAGRLAFGKYADSWLKGKTRIKSKTLDGYRSLLDSRILPTVGRTPLSRIDKKMVTEWVRSMVDDGLSASRIRQAHQCLSAILEAKRVLDASWPKCIDFPTRSKPSPNKASRVGPAGFEPATDGL